MRALRILLMALLVAGPSLATGLGKLTINPNVYPRINWGHPLAKSLLLIIEPRAGELLSKTPPKFIGSGSIKSDDLGYAANSTSTTADGVYYALPSSHPFYSMGANYSWFIVARPVTLMANSAVVAVPYRNGAWADPYYAVVFLMRSGTATVAQWGETNGASWSPQGGGVSGYFQADPQTAYAGSHDSSGGLRWYRNGVLFDTSAGTSAAPALTNKQPVVFLNHSSSDSNEGTVGTVSVFYAFNRVLSDAEQAALAANPFGLLDYGTDVSWLKPSAGGAPPTVTPSRTLTGAGTWLSPDELQRIRLKQGETKW